MFSIALAAACGGPTADPAKPADAPKPEAGETRPAEPAAPAAAAPAPSRAHLAKAEKGKAVTLEKAPEEARKAFWEAIGEGRKKTVGKDYDGAIAAFDRALTHLADHPRALSGRGYAELLAGRLDAAEADLRRALAAPGTRKLESAIVFNLGLVAERRGDAEAARGYFSLANTLNPSKAAAAKLSGAARACPVEFKPAGVEGQLFANWREAWDWLAAESLVDHDTKPADEAAAKAIVCTSEPLKDGSTGGTFDACADDPGGPWLTRRWYDYGGISMVVIEPADSGQIRLTRLGDAGGGRCGASSNATITRGDATVIAWEVLEYAPIEVMEDASGEIVDCDGNGDCFTSCGDEEDGDALAFVFSPRLADPTVIRGPLDERGQALTKVKIEGAEIVVTGPECELRRPLVP